MRNSSLVEGLCAENVTGLKPAAEAVDVQVQGWKFDLGGRNQWRKPGFGWGESGGETQWGRNGSLEYCLGVVGERSSGEEGES